MTTNKDIPETASIPTKSFVTTTSTPLVSAALHPRAGADLPTALADQLLALEAASMQMCDLPWTFSHHNPLTNGCHLPDNMTDQYQPPAYSLSHTSSQLQYVLGVEDFIQESLVRRSDQDQTNFKF